MPRGRHNAGVTDRMWCIFVVFAVNHNDGFNLISVVRSPVVVCLGFVSLLGVFSLFFISVLKRQQHQYIRLAFFEETSGKSLSTLPVRIIIQILSALGFSCAIMLQVVSGGGCVGAAAVRAGLLCVKCMLHTFVLRRKHHTTAVPHASQQQQQLVQ